jgi:hypothetical protein
MEQMRDPVISSAAALFGAARNLALQGGNDARMFGAYAS